MITFWRLLLSSACVRTVSAQLRVPSLIDATIDDLREGLEAGAFSSVDLVTVRFHLQNLCCTL